MRSKISNTEVEMLSGAEFTAHFSKSKPINLNVCGYNIIFIVNVWRNFFLTTDFFFKCYSHEHLQKVLIYLFIYHLLYIAAVSSTFSFNSVHGTQGT